VRRLTAYASPAEPLNSHPCGDSGVPKHITAIKQSPTTLAMLTFSTWNVDATKILVRSELVAVLKDLRAKAGYSANARLNRVIVRLACCSGLRVSEIAALRLDDV